MNKKVVIILRAESEAAFFSAYIGEKGFDCISYDYEEGLDIFYQRENPDVVLIELQMLFDEGEEPEPFGGLRLMEVIKEDLPNLKFIIYDPLPSNDSRQKVINAGADAYVPLRAEIELPEVVAEVLANRKAFLEIDEEM